MLIITTNIVKYTLLYTVDTVKYSMNTEDILEELTKVAIVYPEAGKLRPETNHLLFIPGRPHVPKKIYTIQQ